MSKPSANPDFLLEARTLTATHSDKFFESLTSLYSTHIIVGSEMKSTFDAAKRLKTFLQHIEYDITGLHRPIYHSVLYINQHTSLLRHIGVSREAAMKSPISNRDVYRTIRHLSDIIVHLGLLDKISEYPVSTVKDCALDFYREYYELARRYQIPTLPKRESFGVEEVKRDVKLEVKPEVKPDVPPPQNQTTDWYKMNGYSSFIRSRKVIPQAGILKDKVCKIERFNGNTSLLRTIEEDGAGILKYLNSRIELVWIEE